jgi:hypothetical protein
MSSLKFIAQWKTATSELELTIKAMSYNLAFALEYVILGVALLIERLAYQ